MLPIPALPLSAGQMATILVVTEASLVVAVLMLRRIVIEERAKAHRFRSQLLGAIQHTAGLEGLVSQMLLPIGQAVAHRIANPPPRQPKEKEVKKNAAKQEKQSEAQAADAGGPPEVGHEEVGAEA